MREVVDVGPFSGREKAVFLQRETDHSLCPRTDLIRKEDEMRPTLSQLIRQAELLKLKELLEGYRAFADWHDACVDYLEGLTLEFRERVQTPLDVGKGIAWFKTTFREPEQEREETE